MLILVLTYSYSFTLKEVTQLIGKVITFHSIFTFHSSFMHNLTAIATKTAMDRNWIKSVHQMESHTITDVKWNWLPAAETLS